MEKKETLMVISALCTLGSGIAMAFLSFFLTADHIINDSVLWYFAQCLIYAGSAFGIAAYVHAKINDLGNIIQHEQLNGTLQPRGDDAQRHSHAQAHRQYTK